MGARGEGRGRLLNERPNEEQKGRSCVCERERWGMLVEAMHSSPTPSLACSASNRGQTCVCGGGSTHTPSLAWFSSYLHNSLSSSDYAVQVKDTCARAPAAAQRSLVVETVFQQVGGPAAAPL